MSSDPPPYGFHQNYFSTGGSIPPPPPPSSSINNIPFNHNGVALSYPMPLPEGLNTTTTYPNPFNKETLTRNSSESSSSSSNESSNESYRLDYTQYPPIGYCWQSLTVDEHFPHQNAVRAGKDIDGCNIYVGRAFHEGDMLPAKIIPDKNIAYVSYGGEEIPKTEFEILRRGDFVWEFATNGTVPEGAVQIGRTVDGEILYMGRCLYQGTQTPGKIQPSHGCLYIPFDGEEVSIPEYEVLVVK